MFFCLKKEMERMKKLTIKLLMIFLLSTMFLCNVVVVFSGRELPFGAADPLNYLVSLASSTAYLGIRLWRSKRSSNT